MHTGIFIGHVGRDPEEKVTPTGLKLITFSLAVQAGKDKTMWYDINIWDEKIANFSGIMPHIKKGSKLHVMGKLSMPEVYQAKTGEAKVKCKMQPFSIEFASSGEKKAEAQLSNSTQYQQVPLSNDWSQLDHENPPF